MAKKFDWSNIIATVLGVLLTALVGIAGYVANSLNDLNKNIAVVVSTLAQHQKELDEHDKAIENLRDRQGGR